MCVIIENRGILTETTALLYGGKSIENIGRKICISGIAIGKIQVWMEEWDQVKRVHVPDRNQELRRLDEAKEKAIIELKEIHQKAEIEAGSSEAEIFEVHQMMLDEGEYIEAIRNRIRTESVNAEYAATAAGEYFADMFRKMDNEYMKERAADILDITKRLVRVLSGEKQNRNIIQEPVILAAQNLSPSDTILLDKSMILAFVLKKGSVNSHTAILARAMNIPALIQVPFSDDMEGSMAIVDGDKGKLFLDPDQDFLEEYTEEQNAEQEKQKILNQLKGKETVTKGGRRIELFANIGSGEDVDAVLENDGEGIGLFRSEFLYLGKEQLPSEEEQFQIYKNVVKRMGDKKVIIRTLDLGADKQAPCFPMEKEENPAIGCRGIRLCLEHPKAFKSQLKAILRAGMYGNLSIMYPMITSIGELGKIGEILQIAKQELQEEGKQYKDLEQGIMVETPAAAMISDLLAKKVDFFSIGTNDLTQYTLAMDRQNEKLESFYEPGHEAVLRLIRMVIENAHKAGIWVGICGELGADTRFTEEFVKMGIDELSVSPARILPLRRLIRSIDEI